jgi:WhiB family redox-sensing transcriptional regulator
MSWQYEAACRGRDPELFFPVGSIGPALQQLQKAKQVCGRCPVQSICLEWAIRAGIDHGVWGGMSEDERRSLKRRAGRRQTRRPFEHMPS